MPLAARTFWMAKDARAADQYQDGFAVDLARGTVAIADGVASSLFSATWAKLLTEATTSDPPNTRDAAALGHWLARQRAAWLQPIDVNALAWHQKPKFAEGAAATLLWVRLIAVPEASGRPPRAFRLYAYAIGDCCLFHSAHGEVQQAFPITDSRTFAEKPHVLRSVEIPNAAPATFDTFEDGCEAGDLLALCTDALAQWAIIELESGRQPNFEQFWDADEATFHRFVQDLRDRRSIRVDDTTLVLVRAG